MTEPFHFAALSEPPGVLVVEEDRGVRTLLGIALPRHGLATFLAGSGQQAVELYRQHGDAIAVALIDLGMKDWDGPRTLVALRELRGDLRCCFMTGGNSIYSETDLLALGARRVFHKPFSLEELGQTLAALAMAGERRTAPRLMDRQIKVTVAAVEPGKAPEEGWLWDRSAGGLGIRLAGAVEIGAVLSVRPVATAENTPGQRLVVKHCRRQERGWLVGGQFLGGVGAGPVWFGV